MYRGRPTPEALDVGVDRDASSPRWRRLSFIRRHGGHSVLSLSTGCGHRAPVARRASRALRNHPCRRVLRLLRIINEGAMREADEDLSIERIAQEMIEFDPAQALETARERADEEGRIGNMASAVRWRFIADAIERLQARNQPEEP